MNVTLNIHEFKDKFWREYDFLYEHYDMVAGYREAVDAFDHLLQTSESFKEFVRDFCKVRTVFPDGTAVFDPITSDREAAAFMFAMDSLS